MPQPTPKILIADDEPLLTELLEFRLSARGYQTIVARDGREALAKPCCWT
jgi:CheY-like chemotaxis protein